MLKHLTIKLTGEQKRSFCESSEQSERQLSSLLNEAALQKRSDRHIFINDGYPFYSTDLTMEDPLNPFP